MQCTQLISMDIRAIRHANCIFGKQKPGDGIPILLRPGRLKIFPYIAIPEGMYALVQASGRDIEHADGPVWPAGLHSVSPWIKVSHLVTKQRIVFNTPVKGCKTADDVTVQIDMTITFRIMGDKDKGEDPNLVRKFVYNMGPASLQQQLVVAQEEAARQLARSVTHDQVYGLRGGTGVDIPHVLKPKQEPDGEHWIDEEDHAADDENDEYLPEKRDLKEEKRKRLAAIEHTEHMKRSLNEQFNQYGVQIVNLAITDVNLPISFAKQMQEKTTYSSITAAQKMKQKNDMQLLRYNESLEQTAQRKREEQLAEKATGQKLCTDIQKQVDEVEAETRKVVAFLAEQENTVLREIKATCDLKVTELVTEKETILRKLDAEAQAEAQRVEAETMAEIERINAQADLRVAKNEAQCIKLIGEARKASDPFLLSKREFQLMTEQLDVYKSLAENENLVVSGISTESNNNVLADMLKLHNTKFLMDKVLPSRVG